jgi:tetratricopeptide (TPR) repeat protein
MVLIDRALITGEPEDWDRALAALERSCELARTKPRQAQLWIAHVYGLRGQPDRAVTRYLELAEEERDERGNRTALYLLPAARVLAAQGKPEKAERLYRELMEHQPKDPSAYAELAQLLARAGRGGEAQVVIDALLAGPVRRPRAHLAAAWFYLRDRQPPDATAAARQYELAIEHGHRATDQERNTFLRPLPR